MRHRHPLLTALVSAVMVMIIVGTNGIAAAQEPGGGRGNGRGPAAAAGQPVNTATLPQRQHAEPAAPARGLELNAADFARLKGRIERGELPLAPAVEDPAAHAGDPAANDVGILAAPLTTSFEGFANTGSIPPDPHLAAGPSDLVVAVNRSWRIYNKSGSQLFDTTLLNWFTNVLPANTSGISVFDPWVIYDQVGGRFLLMAVARRDSDSLSQFLISVSDNNTASGNWCSWSLNARLNGSTTTNFWADYPRAGVTNNNIILTANMFSFGSSPTFQYAKLRFLEKADLYNTSCPGANWWDFWDPKNADGTTAFTLEPALSYVNSNTTYLVNSRSGSGSNVTLWRVTTPAALTAAPTFVRQATIGTASYTAPPNAEQRGSTTRIHAGDARLLNLVHRSNGLWTTHSTGCTFTGDTATRSCLRYYQINPSTNTLTQQLTWGASGFYYYYPAVTADNAGNAWIVFNRSGATEFAGIRHTARRGTDPVNTLQGSGLLRAGQGCYVALDTIGRNRWGDYNGVAVDPGGGAWIFSEFAFGTSTTCTNNTWRTQVGRLGQP